MSVLAPLPGQSGAEGQPSLGGRGKGEMMGALAVRVDALLNETRDWPLAGAVDYLIENGLTIVDGWHPLKRGRMDSLRWRFVKLFKRVGVTSPDGWYLCGARGEASGVGWRRGAPPYTSWAWEVARQTPFCCWIERREIDPGGRYRLPEIVGLWADEWPEDWLCDLAILLWCAHRCYKRR